MLKRPAVSQAAFDAGCAAFPSGRCTFSQKYAQAAWMRGFIEQARVEAWRRANTENEAAARWHETRQA